MSGIAVELVAYGWRLCPCLAGEQQAHCRPVVVADAHPRPCPQGVVVFAVICWSEQELEVEKHALTHLQISTGT